MPLSGYGVPPPSSGGSRVYSSGSSSDMPARQSIPNPPALDQITSTSNSRSGGTSSDVVVSEGSKINIGSSNDQNAEAGRIAAATSANNSTPAGTAQLTQAQIDANTAAVAARKQGVLGCINSDVTANASQQPCSPCSTVDCLTQLLTGNLLDLDAKKLLCDTMNNTEKALKQQIDSTGNALLSAAQNLTSAQALKAPLQTLNNFLGKLDPGAVAKCLGAQNVIDNARGQLHKVNKVINDAQNGVHDKLAKKFNAATEAAQQFSIVPNQCNSKGSPASIRSLI